MEPLGHNLEQTVPENVFYIKCILYQMYFMSNILTVTLHTWGLYKRSRRAGFGPRSVQCPHLDYDYEALSIHDVTFYDRAIAC